MNNSRETMVKVKRARESQKEMTERGNHFATEKERGERIQIREEQRERERQRGRKKEGGKD